MIGTGNYGPINSSVITLEKVSYAAAILTPHEFHAHFHNSVFFNREVFMS